MSFSSQLLAGNLAPTECVLTRVCVSVSLVGEDDTAINVSVPFHRAPAKYFILPMIVYSQKELFRRSENKVVFATDYRLISTP